MFDELKEDVFRANLALVERGLVLGTWGNASGADRQAGFMVIKPSGVPYERLTPQSMVMVSLESGAVLEGELKPSSDTPTHLALYRAFQGVGGITHTHSLFATAWAQARTPIPPLGTTHADYFRGPVTCTRLPAPAEIARDYEANIGKIIVEALAGRDPLDCPGVLVAGHGPFTWGGSVHEAVEAAAVLEHLARLASETLRVHPYPRPVPQALLDKHFTRKHGPGSYYGQRPRGQEENSK